MQNQAGAWVRYGDREQYQGYRCGETDPQKPGIIVIQEIWGVDSHIRDVVCRLAAEGYAVLAPNLFFDGGQPMPELEEERVEAAKRFLNTVPSTEWRDEAAREAKLAEYPEVERIRLSQSLKEIFAAPAKSPQYIPAAVAAIRYLQQTGSGSAKRPVAVVGFCMGGGMAAQLALQGEVQASAIFYGNLPKPEQAAELACPVIGFFGELDPRITGQVPAFQEAAEKSGKSFEPHVYPGAQHAFFNDTRSSYHEAASRDAYRRLLDFFRKQVG